MPGDVVLRGELRLHRLKIDPTEVAVEAGYGIAVGTVLALTNSARVSFTGSTSPPIGLTALPE
jgi:hypothetical protein